MTRASAGFLKAFQALERQGLLLKTDPRLPSVAGLVAGAPIKGSWWGHPRGRDIFAVLTRLADHPDLLLVKLVSGKDTFVHRSLWPALISVATSGEPWQTRGLGAAARSLLAKVIEKGRVRTDQVPGASGPARDLQRRLLVHAEELHTETGAHARWLESWDHWARRARFTAVRMPPGRARALLEEKLAALDDRLSGKAGLPWIA